MAIKKNKYSVSVAISSKGSILGYLSKRDEEKGLDIQLDLLGYTIKAI